MTSKLLWSPQWVPEDMVRHPAWQPTTCDENALLRNAPPGSYILRHPVNAVVDCIVHFVTEKGEIGRNVLNVHARGIKGRLWEILVRPDHVHCKLFEEALKENEQLKHPISCDEAARQEQLDKTRQIEKQMAEALIADIKEQLLKTEWMGYHGHPSFHPSENILKIVKQYFEDDGFEFIGNLTSIRVRFPSTPPAHKGEFYEVCRQVLLNRKLVELKALLHGGMVGWPVDFKIGYDKEDIQWFEAKVKEQRLAAWVIPTIHTGEYGIHPKGFITIEVR